MLGMKILNKILPFPKDNIPYIYRTFLWRVKRKNEVNFHCLKRKMQRHQNNQRKEFQRQQTANSITAAPIGTNRTPLGCIQRPLETSPAPYGIIHLYISHSTTVTSLHHSEVRESCPEVTEHRSKSK